MLDINLIPRNPGRRPPGAGQTRAWTPPSSTESWPGCGAPRPAHPGGSAQGRAQQRLQGDRQEQRRRRTPGQNRSHAQGRRPDHRPGRARAPGGRKLWPPRSPPCPTCPTPTCPRARTSTRMWSSRRSARPAIRFHPPAALGPGPQTGHPQLRAGRQDHRLALLRPQRGRRAPAAGPDRLDARPAHPPGLPRAVPALHGQRSDPLRRRAAAQVPRQPLPRPGRGLLERAHRRGAPHRPAHGRYAGGSRPARCATPPTRPASAAKR